MHGRAVQQQLTLIRTGGAAEDLQQRRFAGTILTDERVDLSSLTWSRARFAPKRLVIPRTRYLARGTVTSVGSACVTVPGKAG
jgi:hypothetical protein